MKMRLISLTFFICSAVTEARANREWSMKNALARNHSLSEIRPISTNRRYTKKVQPYINNFGSKKKKRFLPGSEELPRLNNFLKEAIISMNDIEIDELTAVFADSVINVRNMNFTNVNIGDVNGNFTSDGGIDTSDDEYEYKFWVDKFKLDCTFLYEFVGGFFTYPKGKVTVPVKESYLTISINLKSEDFDELPPYRADVISCKIDFDFDFIDFEGDIFNDLLDFFESTFRGLAQDQVEKIICDDILRKSVDGLLTPVLGNVTEFIKPYINIPDEEINYVPQDDSGINLVDFADVNSTVGSFINFIVMNIDDYLSSTVEDPRGGEDLGINVVFRSTLLDEETNDLTISLDGITEEPIVNVSSVLLTLDSAAISGLDTFTAFNPINVFSQTVSSNLELQKLDFEVNFILDFIPIDYRPDNVSLIIPKPVTEKISLSFGLQDIAANVSGLIALDLDIFAAQEVGSFLNITNFLPCVFASMSEFGLTELETKLGDFSSPSIDRVFDEKLGSVISDFFIFFGEISKGVLNKALPNYMATTLRENLTAMAVEYIENVTAIECPKFPSSTDERYIDMRDLLLNASNAKEAGGSGTEPYGDVGHVLKDIVQTNFINPDEDGNPKVSGIILNATESSAGEMGAFDVELNNSMCYQMIPYFCREYEVEFKNLTARNLQSIGYPLNVLYPQDAHQLRNEAQVGVNSDPLKLETRFSFFVDEDESLDDFLLTADLHDAGIFLIITAMLDEVNVMKMPLMSIHEYNCWLAQIKQSQDGAVGLGIVELEIFYDEFNVDVQCITCDTMADVPKLLAIAKDEGGMNIILRSIVTFAQDFFKVPNFSFDELILNATKQCPHHPDYDPFYTAPESSEKDSICYTLPETPPMLTTAGSKAVLSLAVLLLQLVHAGVLLGHRNEEYVYNDPLSEQSLFSFDNTTVLDLSNLNDTFLEWADGPLRLLNNTANDITDDPQHPEGEDIGANVLIRNILDENKSVTVPVGFKVLGLTLDSIRIFGLDSFTNMCLVDTIGPQTLQSSFKLEKLRMELNVTLESTLSSVSVVDVAIIDIGFKDIEVSVAFFIAINEMRLRNLQMGSFFSFTKIVPCLLSTLESFTMSQFFVSVGETEPFKLKGIITGSDSATLLKTHRKILRKFERDLRLSLPVFFDTSVRTAINNFVDKQRSDSVCELFTSNGKSDFIDFRELLLDPDDTGHLSISGSSPYGDLWYTIYGLFRTNTVAKDENGLPKVNDVAIVPVTESLSGTPGSLFIADPVATFDYDLEAAFYGSVGNLTTTAFFNNTISNMDTIVNPFTLMEPEEANILNNTVQVGIEGRPLKVSTRFYLGKTDSIGNIMSDMDLRLTIETEKMGFASLLKALVRERSFMEFPFQDITNVYCWVATVPAPAFDEFGVSIESDSYISFEEITFVFRESELVIECLNCEPQYAYFSTTLSNRSFEYYLEDLVLSGFVQNMIDRFLQSAAEQCPHHPDYLNGTTSNFTSLGLPDTGYDLSGQYFAIFLSLGLFVSAMCFGCFLVRRSSQRNHAFWLLRLSDDEILSLYNEHIQEKEKDERLDMFTKSLFQSAEVPLFLRYSIPFILLGNIGLFISGHLSLGASVDATITFVGKEIEVKGLYTYAILQLIIDLYRFNKSLAGVVFVCSVIWPYTKQVITLFLWYAPPSLVSVRRRGSILRYLDALAKWSMIDIFLIIMGTSIFQLIVNSNAEELTDGYYGLTMLMSPLWGMYANMLAQIVSQITSHFIIYYHDKIAAFGCRKRDEESIGFNEDIGSKETSNELSQRSSVSGVSGLERKEALCKHKFVLGGMNRGHFVQVSETGHLFIGIFCFFTFLSIALGSVIKYIKIDTTGLVGLLIAFGGDSMTVYHNVITVSQQLLAVAEFLGDLNSMIGCYFLALTVILTVVIVPMLQLILVMTVWFVPMTRARRNKLVHSLEIASAWQYVEVFFLGLVTMMWQSTKVSGGLAWFFCRSFNELFSQLAAFNILPEKHARCFLINTGITEGMSIHILGAMMLWWITRFVLKAVDQFDNDVILMQSIGASDESCKVSGSGSDTSREDDDSFPHDSAAKVYKVVKELRSVPLRFTDHFSWLVSTKRRMNDTEPQRMSLQNQLSEAFSEVPLT